jgi:serine protease Do
MAVGSPFGFSQSVTTGIISALDRNTVGINDYESFIQTDAAINPGNSGGPLVNMNGEVIGINTAIYSPNGGSVGIGFAIPSSLAKPVIEQIREHGKVERGWLGVQIQQVTPEIAKSLSLPKDAGALVADVTPGGPAAKAGFKQGDVILSFDGHPIDKVRDLPIVVAETTVGQKADVKVWRKDGETTLTAQIATMPDNPQVAKNETGGAGPSAVQPSNAMGLKLAPLTNELRQQLHLGKDLKGVVVTGVADNSPLADLGLQRGDVIVLVNQQPTVTPKQVSDLLAQAKAAKGTNVLMLINRNGISQYVALTLSGEDKG